MHRILIVDDEAVITMQLKERLTSMGYDVVGSASRGEEAVEKAEELSPDIILMDIVMPHGKLDGIDASHIIQTELDIPVIILTAFGNNRYVERAKHVEPFGYILKPFQDSEVKACIELALHKKETERRLIKAEKMYRRELAETKGELIHSIRFRDELLANISHEFRTPLNAILGMSEVLQQKVYGMINNEQIEALQHISASGHRILSLVTDILDLTEMSAENFDFNMTPVPIDSTFQQSLRRIKPQADKKRLKFLFKTDFDGSSAIICADGRRLKQAIDNLLDNAVIFTPEGGEIGFEILGNAEKQMVFFTVWDTGMGIAKEDYKRLFLPFVQLDGSLSRRHEGAGLGLSLAYQIVKGHGGRISVESEVGKGSRFTVALPWKESGILPITNQNIC